MEQQRGSVVRLTPATKNYEPLTIHTWQTSGSKSGFGKNGDALSKGIADTILTKPDERWLVVVHKPGGRVRDVDQAIRKHLRDNLGDRLATITWGNHMATNAHADVPNVILAGTLFMKDSFYTALTHLAQNRAVEPGLVSPEEVKRRLCEENKRILYCRHYVVARVRKSDGDNNAWPMSAYVIASPRSGIPQDLATIFPGCRVVAWRPNRKALRGNLKRAVEYVGKVFGEGAEKVTYGDMREALKMTPNKFRRP